MNASRPTGRRLVLATANPDKAREIAALLAGTGIELLPRPGDVGEVDETEATLLGNARLKARALVAATGEAAIADDTGLFVDALGGAPGVLSARYSGEDATYAENVAKLLDEIRGREDRIASFRTVALVAYPGGEERWAEGSVRGTITTLPRGEAGFGYDPVFAPETGGGATYAEMGNAAKNACSHRAAAFEALGRLLQLPWPSRHDQARATVGSPGQSMSKLPPIRQ